MANFEENGETVQISLTPNQAKEFASETEGESDSSEDEEMETENEKSELKESEDDQESEVIILRRTPEEIQAVEEKEMMKFVNFMKKQGLVIVPASDTSDQTKDKNQQKGKLHDGVHEAGQGNERFDNEINSVVTIYKNAVGKESSKRDSSSSEEPMDTSDEFDKIQVGPNVDEPGDHCNSIVSRYVAEQTPERNQPQPHCSRNEPNQQVVAPNPMIAEGMIRRSEAKKADIMLTPGRSRNLQSIVPSALLDEDYLVVGSHIDENTRRKIGSGGVC